jgi:purine-binding chemotaxis protein CheW
MGVIGMNQTEMQLLRDRGVDDETEDLRARQTIDFKMVTLSLGGKDYGIDIMRVKEIAKFSQFTYVPNTAPYVRGVYNLRGDIISIIDLRLMFNLPVEEHEEGAPENGIDPAA